MCRRSARRIPAGTGSSTRMDLWPRPAAASFSTGWLPRRCWSVGHTSPGRVSAGSPRTAAAMRLKFSQRNRVGGRDARASGAAKKTLSDLLGADAGADVQTLTRAFRTTVKEYHPDLHRGEATASQQIKVITAAHEVLRDQEQRAAYDQYLAHLHKPPLRSEWRRRAIYGAFSAVCLSLALVSAWKFSVAPTLISQVMAAPQHRPYVEAAAWDLPRDRSFTKDTQIATEASSGQGYPLSLPISARE